MLAVLAGTLLTSGAAPVPTTAQRRWQDLELGMFIHFGPNTWQDREYDDRSTPLDQIRPEELDVRQWVRTAQSFGAKYIVFVAKHVGGFCWWQTETSPYGVRQMAWRNGQADLMADLARACRREGLKLGVYLSPRDDTFGAAGGGRCATPEAQATYNARYRQQLLELLTRYGPIVEVWFDGSLVVPVKDLLKTHAPRAMIFQGPQATIRWVGNEDGFAPYPAWNTLTRADAATGVATAVHGDPDGDAWLPLEVDVSLRRPNWFWSTTNHDRLLSLEALLEIYYRSVGRGANLLLNVTPDRSGRIPEPDVERLAEFGAALQKRFGRALLSRSANTLEPSKPVRVDHVILQEDLRFGERIRAFRVEARVSGEWREVGRGLSVGQKRILATEPVVADAFRLVVEESRGEPEIRKFAIYNAEEAPPPTWNAPAGGWADDSVGSWDREGEFELDLTPKLTAATVYRIRFAPSQGAKVRVTEPQLTVEGVLQPDWLTREPGREDVLRLTLPGLATRIRLKVTLQGASSGQVLVSRV